MGGEAAGGGGGGKDKGKAKSAKSLGFGGATGDLASRGVDVSGRSSIGGSGGGLTGGSGNDTLGAGKPPAIGTPATISIASIDKVTSVPNGPKDTRGLLGKGADLVSNNPALGLLGLAPGGIAALGALASTDEETQASLGLDPGGVAGHDPDFDASSKSPSTPSAPTDGEGGGPTPRQPTPTKTASAAPNAATTTVSDPLADVLARRRRATARASVSRTQGGSGSLAFKSLLGA